LGLLACAPIGTQPGATTQTALALKRVVLYRNGVGYFERGGTLEGSELRLKVRKDQINDLLKSLAVVDRGSGKVLGVSIPLDPQSWHKLALSALAPGQGRLAQMLDGLRGTRIEVQGERRNVAGRIVMVEPMQLADGGEDRHDADEPVYQDYKLSLLDGAELHVVRLSQIRSLTLQDGDVVMQLDRHLDASAGEGMFQQVELTIRLTGGARHELSLSYVAPAPLWKPTYRVVLDDKTPGHALLQAWAVVDNTSGESWDSVQLSLTSGAPIAFRYDLHTPREVERPDLSYSAAEKQAQVALGERSFEAQGMAAPAAEPQASAPAEAPEAEQLELDEAASQGPARDKGFAQARRGGGAGAEAKKARSMMAPAAPMPAPAPAMTLQALQASAATAASAARVAGLTRFDLAERVTLPDGSATMVALVNQLVSGEQVFLYRPGGSGQGYEWNPYRVVRFRNDTDFVLEPGPISIYANGSFVGEGLSEAIGSHELATIPFAVEPSILVRSRIESEGDETRVVKLIGGVLEVESFHRLTTVWTVSGSAQHEPYRVLVRHPRQGGNYELVEPKQGVEKLADAYFVEVTLASGVREQSVKVVEQTPSKTSISIWDGAAVPLLDTLLSAPDLDPATRKKLEPVIQKRREMGRIDSEVASLQAQQGELDQRVNETRESLRAIQKDPHAAALRKRLGQRLEQFLHDADAAGRKIVELQSKRLELKIALEDLLQKDAVEDAK
jgi:outer membrane murein-binding lipoprotein Lpp